MHTSLQKISIVLFLVLNTQIIFAQTSELSVDKIMQDPSWMGTFPSNIKWSADSKTIYFNYNLQKDPADSLYKINLKNPDEIIKASFSEEQKLESVYGDYNSKRSKRIYTQDGHLKMLITKTNSSSTLIDLGERISNPQFMENEDLVSFNFNDNIYIYSLSSGSIKKVTNIKNTEKKENDTKKTKKDEWLENENLSLLQIIKERKEKKEKSDAYKEMVKKDPFVFYTGSKVISNLQLSPSGKYATFNLITRSDNKNTIVPNYVDASGYTQDLNTRSKVGDEPGKIDLLIYNIEKDTVYPAQTNNLPGIQDQPDYVKYYPNRTWEKSDRSVIPWSTIFSDDSQNAIVNIRSTDNKDRWITLLDLDTGKLKNLDRQRDEAWIAGPGIGYSYSSGTLGWLPDNKTIYFQSEQSGYSHLYLLNIETTNKQALTAGEYEVFEPFISSDKKSWYLTTSQEGPGERHFYKMPLYGGKMEKLTTVIGNNDVYLSPDEKQMVILYSYSNKPWELYIKKTSSNSIAKQLTSGQSEEFTAYKWRDPDLIKFQAEDGTMVPARIYQPEISNKNGTAVIFVHGAGYLQNAHKWWSSYFREYMFHNLLTDLGYTVLDIDYRGSAGYGRDWRTGIYRHMGGKDLSDQVDGAEYLVAEHGIDKDNIGIYGGSYGGFITLMALFNEAETFKSGAALRSVTDWAHYNDGYTSNILNTPEQDPIAYKQSSPIYFAEGLKGNLLIAHGMLDVNVHFQDVVRLSQRLIELKKENWEMALYPVEDHGFIEPSSWTDEYKRILNLFNETLLNK
ncbi:prolyl oligopeptidase family serine peptidase [Gillisia sp. M10.2A]|uniref:Prolyl oligopeptidase family serine peptidase n=1 Tax=Gillisia lutea TaxID=2909668 RepID=A0ABS9EGN4_9FLAO|nr:prolyl oligopeptidase family serine peptidase [Gillisia lutea]MCF4102040.1 prolyl oligopeptidase family serine peptidase [Gillisia lutea]